ncbi:endonuclease/exonuclease/phosphatase family protein [Actibacterium lipolyticum]|uniref:Endonuclease/exonuclease/phosphatase domain-containing protein n=1 Tax=Actibacterium lipolyticum TaxID=1524263 RepID=A0A238KUT1_9RHOB|nr:endonuclease/exonuclease/phosphatase family protein [Actibacterium lipolyticum]SMX46583.1 hypothetical protein COL8621_03171 [Actibacterium lipolyticum]
MRDILSGDDPQVSAVISVITEVQPDVLLLQGIDYDLNGATVSALIDALDDAGQSFDFIHAGRPNSGVRTGLDHDGDGTTDSARDAQGFGRFPGEGGMALLSRFPIDTAGVKDFSALLWADLPGGELPVKDGAPFPSAELYTTQRLSSVAHWDVPVLVAGRPIHILAFHATPPVFDGPEDMNGLRNRDELRLWMRYLDGALGEPAPDGPFVVLGDANLDPFDGDGLGTAMQEFMADPRLRALYPESDGGRLAPQSGANAGHNGDPAQDTVAWADNGPGNMRVDYALPSVELTVTGTGVYWPAPGDPGAEVAAAASRHRLVWLDVMLER